ncbi:MAG: hypothetical protein R3A47_03500 [Polyangiales bacterium]
MTEEATFRIDDKDVSFPVVEGTEHEKGIDIKDLRSRTGAVTLDPGFVNTASTTSSITTSMAKRGFFVTEDIRSNSWPRNRPLSKRRTC